MPKVWLSSTVMTPSLPTFSSDSAIIEPISLSAAEMAATLAICAGSVSTFFEPGLDRVDRGDDRGLDALLQDHRVRAGGDVAQTLTDHGPREHGGGRRAVTGDVVGLLGDFLDQLGADLLVRVLEVDLLGDGDAVVGDRGCAPLLLEDDVAALRAERDADGVGELVHARLERPAGVLVVGDLLRHVYDPLGSRLGERWVRQWPSKPAPRPGSARPDGLRRTWHSDRSSANPCWHSRTESANGPALTSGGTRAGSGGTRSGGSPPR